MNRRHIFLFFVPAVLCMGAIFWFSAQNARISSDMSGSLIAHVLSRLTPDFDTLSTVEQAARISAWQFLVRKSAHFCIYMLLGALLSIPYMRYLRRTRAALPAAWATALLFAVTDEVHQYFVPGRSCEARDVAIDASGALLGVLLFWLIRGAALRKPHTARKKSNNTLDR